MNISGRVQNGVIVLDAGQVLPDGLPVVVFVPSVEPDFQPRRRVQLPLVPSNEPGTLNLTAERVAELLDDGHVSA
ncbi:MAG: hypothetical protein JNL96_04935 [Planctomycetaceae bacterium]|nr:hypothetical protein [Planctomycetaceae bacterium]